MSNPADRIHCAGPSITEKEVDYVADAVRTCWYGDAGKYHDRFERAAAEYLGVKHVVTTPTGTSAIHLALLALGVGPGDEVIVPELTWIGSSAPVTYVGARPVFADVERDSCCISAASLEKLITPRTRAAIIVDLYGNLPDVAALRSVATRNGVALIEDAAQAFGTEWENQKAGTLGTAGIFSFHGSKTITTGEGGMLVTDYDDVYQRAMTLRDHGRRVTSDRFYGEYDRYYYHFEIGNKFKMSSMQAALGLAQIERADELVAKKRDIFTWYVEELSDCNTLTMYVPPQSVRSSYWLPLVTIDPECGLSTQSVIRQLEDQQIDVRPCYYPLSSQPAYEHEASATDARQRNATAYEVSPYAFNLPSNLRMTRSDAARVACALRRVCDGPRPGATVHIEEQV